MRPRGVTEIVDHLEAGSQRRVRVLVGLLVLIAVAIGVLLTAAIMRGLA